MIFHFLLPSMIGALVSMRDQRTIIGKQLAQYMGIFLMSFH